MRRIEPSEGGKLNHRTSAPTEDLKLNKNRSEEGNSRAESNIRYI